MTQTLANQVALVTGAGSGMGRAIAEEFVRAGAKVVAVDLNEAAVKATAETIGEPCFPIAADISQPECVSSIYEAATKHFGTVDVLVNNAGIWDDYAVLTETSNDLWDKVFGVNLKAMFMLCRAFVPWNGRERATERL